MVILLAMSNIAFGADATVKSDSLYKKNKLKNDEPTTFYKLDLKCRALTNSDFNEIMYQTHKTFLLISARIWIGLKIFLSYDFFLISFLDFSISF